MQSPRQPPAPAPAHRPESAHRRNPQDIELIATRVAQLLASCAGASGPARMADAATVAHMLGVDRDWVYAHARELGAVRLGGPHARTPRLSLLVRRRMDATHCLVSASAVPVRGGAEDWPTMTLTPADRLALGAPATNLTTGAESTENDRLALSHAARETPAEEALTPRVIREFGTEEIE